MIRKYSSPNREPKRFIWTHALRRATLRRLGHFQLALRTYAPSAAGLMNVQEEHLQVHSNAWKQHQDFVDFSHHFSAEYGPSTLHPQPRSLWKSRTQKLVGLIKKIIWQKLLTEKLRNPRSVNLVVRLRLLLTAPRHRQSAHAGVFFPQHSQLPFFCSRKVLCANRANNGWWPFHWSKAVVQ